MGVKTVKKVAVKKGKRAISGTKPKPASGGKRLSLGGRNEELNAAVLSMVASVKETGAYLKSISADLTQKLAASEADLSQKLAASEAMLSDRLAASEAIRVASETKLSEKLAETNNALKRGIGGLRNSIGEIVELVLLPGLKQKLNEFGHAFNISSQRKEFSRPDGSLLTEVDLLLENCDEVMVVEAKTLFTMEDVKWHLERLKKLRENESITGMRGKTIYAGAAGMRFAEGVIQKITENGLYLIKIDEDNDRVTVTAPTGKTGTW